MYACIDRYVRDELEKLLIDKLGSIEMDEPKFASERTAWWKTISSIDGTIGTLNNKTEFSPVQVRSIINATGKGLAVNGEVAVFLKYSTTDGTEYVPGMALTAFVDFVRVYISAVDVDIAMPARAPLPKDAPPPTRPSRHEVTNDSVLERLAGLKLA